MKPRVLQILLFLACMTAVFPSGTSSRAQEPRRTTNHPFWVLAYYPTWEQAGPLTPDKIDFSALTHIVQFCLLPKPDGTLDDSPGRAIPPADSQELIARAHAAGCKVLVAVGGEQSRTLLRGVIAGPARDVFIHDLVRFVVSRGYDGMDMDMEPVQDDDVAPYERFIPALRAQLIAANPKLLLTAAVAGQPALFARLQDDFDQINIMTYDLSGPWTGFNTWFNASLNDSGSQLMPEGAPYPSVIGSVRQFAHAGVAKSKMGIGIAFFGYVWTGATGPRQSIQGTSVTQPSYHEIMDTYFQTSRLHWDAEAHAPYLSIDAPQTQDRKFISYDNERLCAEKVGFAKSQGLGGVMIWQLGDGYRESQPAGEKDALLQAIKRAWRDVSPTDPARQASNQESANAMRMQPKKP